MTTKELFRLKKGVYKLAYDTLGTYDFKLTIGINTNHCVGKSIIIQPVLKLKDENQYIMISKQLDTVYYSTPALFGLPISTTQEPDWLKHLKII